MDRQTILNKFSNRNRMIPDTGFSLTDPDYMTKFNNFFSLNRGLLDAVDTEESEHEKESVDETTTSEEQGTIEELPENTEPEEDTYIDIEEIYNVTEKKQLSKCCVVCFISTASMIGFMLTALFIANLLKFF